MSWNPTRYLLDGELNNTRAGKVTGWMRFAGMATVVTINLDGDFHPDIRGTRLHLRGSGDEDDPIAACYMAGFEVHQAGKAGDIVVSPTGWGMAFIEWYDRHNGRVVIELTADQVQILGTLRPWLNPLSMHDEPTGAIFVTSPERRMSPIGTSSVVHARDLCRS